MYKILKYLSVLFFIFYLACEKKVPNQVISINPTISIHDIPAAIKRTSDEITIFMVKVNDPQGIRTIREVRIEINQGRKLIEAGLMWDDGQNGDIIAKNGTFTYSIIPEELSFSLGMIVLTIQAEDEQENLSTELYSAIFVKEFLINNPPEISEVSAPATISRSQGGSHMITAKVSDPQGLPDIQKVFFNSFKPPDGSPASGNPFLMYDTGNNGDLQANDGIYSFQFSISPSNDIGEYRFEIQAQDNSVAMSNKVVHIITVTQ